MKVYEKSFKNDYWEAIKYEKLHIAVVKNKIENKYYEVPINEIQDEGIEWECNIIYHSTFIFLIYVTIFILFSVINITGFILTQKVNDISFQDFLPVLIVYMVVFIVSHEMGHYVMCRLFGRTPEKIGFKFNYIFPAFYVRMNEVYLLDKIEKVYVHSAGLMVSLFMNGIVFLLGFYLHNHLLKYLGAYVVFDIFMNALPLMNSDGYKILITLLNLNEKKKMMESSKIIIAFKGLNYIICIIYTIWFVRTMLT